MGIAFGCWWSILAQMLASRVSDIGCRLAKLERYAGRKNDKSISTSIRNVWFGSIWAKNLPA